ncbi:MAG: hypothetical protein JWN11_505 [Hyphomicrobiales bacterium]|nr:hypothetical protein [Hyphomicrobiales bacterium]
MARRGRRRSASRPGSGKTLRWLGIGLFGALLVALVAGFGIITLRAYQNNPTLLADLCPETGPVAQTLVLLDTTDAWPALTQSEVTSKLHDIRDGLKKGELLQLYLLDPLTMSARTVFSQCNPGDGSDLNDVTGNPRMARERWGTDFDKPLEAALASSVSTGQADSSPIMGAIQKMAVDRSATAKDKSAPTHYVVISDMLEHTQYFSAYKSGADFSAFKASDASRRFATDLAGAKTEVWIVQRPKEPAATRDLAEFWASWVAANNGSFDKAVLLQGVAP